MLNQRQHLRQSYLEKQYDCRDATKESLPQQPKLTERSDLLKLSFGHDK